jgi:linoleoyl-CoA desaturase
MSKPKFKQPSLTFTQELKQEINSYFENLSKQKTGNWYLWSKALILISTVLLMYTCLVIFKHSGWLAIAECLVFAVAASGIGFNVMHDGGHGSFSEHGWLNKVAVSSLDILGASSFMWNTKHNIIHHTYTNIEGVDDDIEAKPFLRFCTSQPKYSLHKYQHIYFWIFYSLLYIFWVFAMDIRKYFTKKIGNIDIPKMKPMEHFMFWFWKVLYTSLFVVIPIIRLGFGNWVIGYLTFGVTTGLLISIVFQLAHTVEHTHMVKVQGSEPGFVEDEWTKHQIRTTANFAVNNKIVNWFTGGLNFQVVHHLFPKISHVHYPKINEIIKKVCLRHKVDYIEYKNTRQAIWSHIKFLKQMGVAA